MISRPLYIFDVDGTVSLVGERRRLLEDFDDSHRWQKFYARCGEDSPNPPVILVLRAIVQTGAEVWFWSGRSHDVRGITVEWLSTHTPLMRHEVDRVLRVREPSDTRPDDVVKREWYAERTLIEDQNRLVCTFDDRNRIVQMWRDLGVTCMQVAHGDF